MGRSVSMNTKVQQLTSMADGKLTEWEDGFLENISRQTDNGKNCQGLSEKQTEAIERMWDKYFA